MAGCSSTDRAQATVCFYATARNWVKPPRRAPLESLSSDFGPVQCVQISRLNVPQAVSFRPLIDMLWPMDACAHQGACIKGLKKTTAVLRSECDRCGVRR